PTPHSPPLPCPPRRPRPRPAPGARHDPAPPPPAPAAYAANPPEPVGEVAAKAAAVAGEEKAALGVAAHAAAAAHEARTAVAAEGLVADKRHAIEDQRALVEDGTPGPQAAAAAAEAVAAPGEAALQRQDVQRQAAQGQLGVHAARDVEQAEGRRARRRAALDGGAVALDGDVVVDGRQPVGAVPVLLLPAGRRVGRWVVRLGQLVDGAGRQD